MPESIDPLISISAAAREIGVHQSTISKQVREGLIRAHDGKVRLSRVLADRAANIDLGRSNRRRGAIDEPERTEVSAFAPNPAKPADAVVSAEPDDESDGPPVTVDGVAMDYADARALKETYLARLKQLEFEMKRGELNRVKDMQERNDEVAMVVRERLLSIPGECSDVLTQDQVEFVKDRIYDAMEDLSALGLQAEDHVASSRGADDDDAPNDEAAAAPRSRGVGRAVPLRRAEVVRRAR